MAAHRVVDADILRRKRQLRAEIARTREATQATLGALADEKRRLTSWKTYVRRFPWVAMVVSFAAGLWVSGARRKTKLPRTLAAGLIQWGIASARSGVWTDLLAIWTASRPRPDDPDTV
jgi:hypothetical protein